MNELKNINKIQWFYIIVSIGIIILLYMLLPTILNYPPNSIDNELQKSIDGLIYSYQFALISFIGLSVAIIVLVKDLGKIKKYITYLKQPQRNKQMCLDKITTLCIRTPIKVYLTQILVPLFLVPFTISLIGTELVVVFKISIIFIVFFSLSAVISFVLFQKEYQKLMIDIYEKNTIYQNNMIKIKPRISIKTKIILEIIPLIMIALVLTGLLSYNMNSSITGDIYFKTYYPQLKHEFCENEYQNKESIFKDLADFYTADETISKFIMNLQGEYVTLDESELSTFFIQYALKEEKSNRSYDYYCVDREGTFVKVDTLDGHTYLVGLAYDTNSDVFLIGIVVACILLFGIVYIILFYIAFNLSKDIKQIKEGLNQIIKEQNLDKALIVVSNDETGELTEAYNKVQELAKEHINEIKEKQELLIRQEKLSILGEMAVGIAHDINNPAAAINMSINVLYQIEDKDKQKEILDNMKECTKRILDIVSSVRDQFRNIGDTKKEIFNINDILHNIEIVIKNQLTKYNCKLEMNYEHNFKVYGEKNKLNQVLSNLIMNSILAYKDIDSKGLILVDTEQEEEYNVIKVIDNAGGIPENIREKLFSKIITTRGIQGTGLGLYLAKSIIEDEFKGNIYFETETGKGTTFYIRLKKVVE